MTSMKHYHLGCGESLKSNWSELRFNLKTADAARARPRYVSAPKAKPEKQH